MVTSAESTLGDELRRLSAGRTWNRLRVCVAYATSSGLDYLFDTCGLTETAFTGACQTEWLIGLSDSITEPSTLTRAAACAATNEGSAQGMASALCVPASRERFHPKIYELTDEAGSISIVGSSNMTRGGMAASWEANIVVDSDLEALGLHWTTLSAIGKPITEEIDRYRGRYEHDRRNRLLVPADATEDRQSDPESSGTSLALRLNAEDGADARRLAAQAWLEIGRGGSSTGRNPGITREVADYFGLDRSMPSLRIPFRLVDGTVQRLKLTNDSNSTNPSGTWKLSIPKAVFDIEGTPDDIRGSDRRSPLVMVFDRLNDDPEASYRLLFIRNDGEDFKHLRAASDLKGQTQATGQTIPRRYGLMLGLSDVVAE